jgi:hypothetical protein
MGREKNVARRTRRTRRRKTDGWEAEGGQWGREKNVARRGTGRRLKATHGAGEKRRMEDTEGTEGEN